MAASCLICNLSVPVVSCCWLQRVPVVACEPPRSSRPSHPHAYPSRPPRPSHPSFCVLQNSQWLGNTFGSKFGPRTISKDEDLPEWYKDPLRGSEGF